MLRQKPLKTIWALPRLALVASGGPGWPHPLALLGDMFAGR